VIGGSNGTNTNDSGDLSRLRISDPFDGFIDEVAFYGSALSAAEIAQSRQRGAMGVIAPEDVFDFAHLVSIEKIAFAGSASASIQGTTMLANAALVNVATFSGVHGSIDLGTFDGRASAANPDPAAWTSVLKQGLDLLRQTFQAPAETQVGKPATNDWVIVTEDTAKAADPGAGANANLQGSVKVDWKDLFSGFAVPFLSRGSTASRTPQQPNIAEFKAPSPSKDGRR
jgi:hypothetical protein